MHYLNIVLKDDDTKTGGVAYKGEILKAFMDDLAPHERQSLDDVNESLKGCGILPITETNYPEIQYMPYFFSETRDLRRLGE